MTMLTLRHKWSVSSEAREKSAIKKRPRKSFSPGSCAAMFFSRVPFRVSLDGLSERGDYLQSSCVVMLKRFLLENSWKEKVIQWNPAFSNPRIFEPPDNSNQKSFSSPQWNSIILSPISRTLGFFEPFSNLQGKRQMVRKMEEFEKSGVKLQCSTEERETTFGSSYRVVRKIEGSRNRDSTVQ